MCISFFKLKNFIPDSTSKTVYDIDYEKYYKQNKRLIMMDIDNTLIPYDLSEPTDEIVQLSRKLQEIGFTLVFVSNNNRKRVENFASKLDCKYIASAKKPFSYSYRRVKKMFPEFSFDNVLAIGDQIITDVLGANRMGVTCILVKVLKRNSEKWYTKINRRLENFVLKKIKTINLEKYEEIISLGE